MSGFRDKGFGDRLSTAQTARKAMLERVRAKPGADDPAVAERRAAREAVSTDRDARLAERKANRIAEQAREAEEREAADHEQRLAHEADEAVEVAEAAQRQAALEAEQKAARDARYAARKVRK